MPRLLADAAPDLWVPITGSFGLRGRRARKKAIGMLLATLRQAQGPALRQAQGPASGQGPTLRQAQGPGGGQGPRAGGGVAAWLMSQAAPALMRKAAGRVLVWVWKPDPELLVVMAQLQEATPQLRAARAMMPMEYDDTESFRGTYLGVGEKLAMPLPPTRADGATSPPFATYTWDTGTHFVTVTAVCADRERFGTVIGAVDDLARSLRVAEDLTVGESNTVLRIDPS